MKIRRILAAVLAAAIITVISGCGTAEETGGESEVSRLTAGEVEVATTLATTTEAPKPAINLPLVVKNNTVSKDYYIDIAGNVKAYGSNDVLMTGVKYIKSIYVQEPTAYSEGSYVYYFIKNDNTLWGFGDGKYLGDNTGITKDTIDKAVLITDNVAEIKPFNQWIGINPTIYIIKRDKTLWGWGDNSQNQFFGSTDDETVYVPLKLMDNVIQIDLTEHAAVAVKASGEMYGWTVGTISINPNAIGTTCLVYEDVSTTRELTLLGTDIKSFGKFGKYDYYVVKTDDTLWTWQYNVASLMGSYTGEETVETSPEQRIHNVKSVFTSFDPDGIYYGNYSNISVIKDGWYTLVYGK